MSARSAFRFRELPLFGKLLVPFLVLMLIAGVLGALLIVRDLSSRAETTLDESLSRRSLTARSLLHDRELYLLESVSFASNLEGIAPAVERERLPEVNRLLQSVVALKTDLTLLAVTDREGIGVRSFLRRDPGDEPTQRSDDAWGDQEFVARVLNGETADKASGFLQVGKRTVLAVAGPICSQVRRCASVGAAIAGIDVDLLVAEAAGRGTGPGSERITGAALFASNGVRLASVGSVPTDRPPAQVGPQAARRTDEVDGEQVATLYAPLQMQGRPVGVLAVSTRTGPVFAAVRGAGYRLAFILLAAMVGVMGIGAFLSRTILRQVRPLVETNRRLGAGDFSARTEVLSGDELGELATGVNQMAEQLQASYETLEMRVSQRTEEVQRLLRERNELFAAMSHEFRTPLAVIMGQADMIVDPSYRKTLKWAKDTGGTIKQSAAQLLSVVNDILNLAKAEAGELEVDLVEVDLSEAVSSLEGTIQGLTHAAGLETEIDIPADLPRVLADPIRLQEILVNLIDNAVKYTPAGGRVEIRAGRAKGKMRVSVTDTGVGIPPEAADRIFEPFFRVKGTEPQAGQASSGLGLALTRRLVEAQGGEIDYESEIRKGTTFTFTVPVAAKRPRSVPPRRLNSVL
jgi:signal transduction histidine kinase